MQNPNLKQPVAIIGMGMSGEATYRLLQRFSILPATFDENSSANANYRDPQKLLNEYQPKTLVVSPGVPLSTPWIQEFKKNGGYITSELSLALEQFTTEKIMAVTGALGKSTTVSILEAGFKKFSKTSFLGGNIGRPLADYICEVLEGSRERAEWVVLELSSYQLENIEALSCDFSAITYLTGNHLDRYTSLNHYYETKWSLLEKTKEKIVLNKHGGDLVEFTKNKQSIKILWTERNTEVIKKYHLNEAKLLGQHNQDNLAVAATLAELANWPTVAFDGMREFPGLPHRMENIGVHKNVLFVNDSKATTMDSVKTAVEGVYKISVPGHLHLLLGGKDKHLPWEELNSLSSFERLRIMFFGECGKLAKEKCRMPGECFKTLKEALESLPYVVKANDIVLLSPGGTSFDEFKNFEHRGDFFKSKVHDLFG